MRSQVVCPSDILKNSCVGPYPILSLEFQQILPLGCLKPFPLSHELAIVYLETLFSLWYYLHFSYFLNLFILYFYILIKCNYIIPEHFLPSSPSHIPTLQLLPNPFPALT